MYFCIERKDSLNLRYLWPVAYHTTVIIFTSKCTFNPVLSASVDLKVDIIVSWKGFGGQSGSTEILIKVA